MSTPPPTRPPSGFALFDIVLLIGFLALLLSIVLPELNRKSLLKKALHLRGDLEKIEIAAARAADALEIPSGSPVGFDQYLLYFENDHRPSADGRDPLGNPYGTQPARGPARVPPESYRILAPHLEDQFWAPFALPAPEGAHGEGSG